VLLAVLYGSSISPHARLRRVLARVRLLNNHFSICGSKTVVWGVFINGCERLRVVNEERQVRHRWKTAMRQSSANGSCCSAGVGRYRERFFLLASLVAWRSSRLYMGQWGMWGQRTAWGHAPIQGKRPLRRRVEHPLLRLDTACTAVTPRPHETKRAFNLANTPCARNKRKLPAGTTTDGGKDSKTPANDGIVWNAVGFQRDIQNTPLLI